ncbi:MAG TPA: hypothetical protein VEC19_08460 [Usitatibacter sp.]|nr:hypothetical protein [Usitatibacter sp.]
MSAGAAAGDHRPTRKEAPWGARGWPAVFVLALVGAWLGWAEFTSPLAAAIGAGIALAFGMHRRRPKGLAAYFRTPPRVAWMPALRPALWLSGVLGACALALALAFAFVGHDEEAGHALWRDDWVELRPVTRLKGVRLGQGVVEAGDSFRPEKSEANAPGDRRNYLDAARRVRIVS